jgi:N-acyl-D-aspartate/D-glutamate deacylase
VFDLLLRRATIVDGTGAPRTSGDIGISGGRIAAIGDLGSAASHQEIDAGGTVACPGFIDLHTHYDAQLFWDPDLTPSSLHGVTTVISGNCGFSVAPLTAGDPYLIRLLSRVEGIPLPALQMGVPWHWDSTEGYLGAVAGAATAVNIGLLVGHSALRRYVMGTAATERAASGAELAAMTRLLRTGLRAGGLGLSSTRSSTHSDGEGEPVPSRWADEREFTALAAVCGEFEGTSIETSPAASTGVLGDDDVNLMIAMSLAGGSPVNWNAMTVSAAEAAVYQPNLEVGSRAAERGARVVAMTIPMPAEVRYSFVSGVFLDSLPGWDVLMRLPLPERLAQLRDPAARKRLGDLAQQPGPRRAMAEWSALTIVEGFTPRTRQLAGRTVGQIAAEQAKDPFDVLCDAVIDDEGRTGLARIPGDLSTADWTAKLAVWRDRRAVVGASDAGAHLDVLGMFNYPTWILQEAVRRHRLVSLEEAVALLTSVPAELYGLHDRGVLAPGGWADIVLLDEDQVGTEPLRTVADLPDGSGRIYAGSTGIERVLVAGQTVVAGGRPTGTRSGQVLRRGTDTRSPSLSVPA